MARILRVCVCGGTTARLTYGPKNDQPELSVEFYTTEAGDPCPPVTSEGVLRFLATLPPAEVVSCGSDILVPAWVAPWR